MKGMPGRAITAVALLATVLQAQHSSGELRISIADPTGAPIHAHVDLASQSTQARRSVEVTPEGTAILKLLPFGPYVLRISAPGFAPRILPVEIRSELPQTISIRLTLAPLDTALTVTDAATILDPARVGTPYHVGPDLIEQRRTTTPSRSVLELVESQPGWLLEANGVLHPRGAEYGTQYVVDGIPITDNRSPGIAPPLEAGEIASMTVMTGGYPAEFGRKLGGVVEVTTSSDPTPGWSGSASAQGGSFGTAGASAGLQYARGRSAAAVTAYGALTDRYLDPPTEQNFSNRGSNSGVTARYEREWNDRNRTRWLLARRRVHFQVPNEAEQQEAGQRQDRDASETSGQFRWSRILSPSVLLNTRVMARELDARLWSNALSTPMAAFQDRGFRELYTNASLAGSRSRHEWKAGAEWITASVREQFRYRITDRERFDDDVAPAFAFAARQRSREASGYVQDLVRVGNWAFNLGLRWDRYRFVVHDSAFSPRLGAAWYWPGAGLALRASYDRAFETPAVENLLLSSSADAAEDLSPEAALLPVRPSRAHFWQAGFSQRLGGFARLDGTWFRRQFRNYADDEVLLNTGISFPIAFDRAEVEGFEGKLEIPGAGRWSGWLSWSNLSGTGTLPVTGGLFLEGVDQLLGRQRFRITQDQRTTVQGRARFQAARRVWLALGTRYGSGLPVELEDEPDTSAATPAVLSRVDLERGRVRPNWSLDAAAGVTLLRLDRRAARLQIDGTNLTDRLNVINFSGLFSGTAIAAPRAVMARFTVDF